MMAKYAAILVAVLATLVPLAVQAAQRKLLIVSFDGFRRDYLDRGLTPNFQKFLSRGVLPSKSTPCFPTYTQSCHYTMVTGRHVDHHGVVANTWMDHELGFFLEGYNNDYHFWNYNNTEPLWITAKKHGHRVVGYGWSGIHVNFVDQNGKSWQADYYKRKIPKVKRLFQRTIRSALSELQNGASLALVHHSQPDNIGHKAGPDHPSINQTIIEVDGRLGYLMEQVSLFKLEDQLNIVLVADHGMATIEKTVNIGVDFNITQNNYLPWTFGGLMFMEATGKGIEHELYETLQAGKDDFATYYRQDIPERFHYGKNPRITNLVLLPKTGVLLRPGGNAPILERLPQLLDIICSRSSDELITKLCKLRSIVFDDVNITMEEILTSHDSINNGTHGYDNMDPRMEPILMMAGPDFKKGVTIGDVHQVDYYSLFTHLLNINGQPNDGSFDRFRDALVNPDSFNHATSVHFSHTLLLGLLAFALFARLQAN